MSDSIIIIGNSRLNFNMLSLYENILDIRSDYHKNIIKMINSNVSKSFFLDLNKTLIVSYLTFNLSIKRYRNTSKQASIDRRTTTDIRL